jgi:hypothetical protein
MLLLDNSRKIGLIFMGFLSWLCLAMFSTICATSSWCLGWKVLSLTCVRKFCNTYLM